MEQTKAQNWAWFLVFGCLGIGQLVGLGDKASRISVWPQAWFDSGR